MINRITVSEKRGLFPQYSNLGTIGEKNATTLLFLLPVALQGYSEKIVCETAQGSFNYTVSNDDTFDLPSEVLTDNTLTLQLVLKDGDKVIWKSVPYTFTLNPTLDDSGENPITKAKAEQREDDRTELGGTLSDLTGQDLKEADWNELIDIANELPIKTEQDIIDLTNCEALTYAFERSTSVPSLLTGAYKLDKEDPDDADSPDVLIKLPYLNTKNCTKFIYNVHISDSVEECGFDISKSPNFNRSHEQRAMGSGRSNLKKLKVTGLQAVASMNWIFAECPALTLLELYCDGDFVVPEESLRGYFYYYAFIRSKKLQCIAGDPLDLSVTTHYDSMFESCNSLRHVRFKPGTIRGNLSFADCPAIIKKYESTNDDPGTLISILNGVREYRDGMDKITLTFSIFVKDYLTLWRCEKDPKTGLYVSSNTGNTIATVLTNEKGVIIA